MRLEYIQALRALAASMVVLFHAQGLTYKYTSTVSPSRELMGALGGSGVDLFFVISGFVIYLTTRRDKSWSKFMQRRLARIVPLYWLLTTTLAVLVIALPSAFSGALANLQQSYAESLLFGAFLADRWPMIYVGWSLEYEMIFYILAALVLAVGRDIGRLLPGLLVLIYASAAAASPPPASGALALLSSSILLEFALGVVVARLLIDNAALDALAIMLAMILVVALLGSEHRLIERGVPWAIVLAAVVWLELRLQCAGRSIALLGLLGDASYAIYLVQVFTLSFAGKVFQAFAYHWHPELLVWPATAFTIAVGVLVHVLAEKPIVAALNGPRPPPRSQSSTEQGHIP